MIKCPTIRPEQDTLTAIPLQLIRYTFKADVCSRSLPLDAPSRIGSEQLPRPLTLDRDMWGTRSRKPTSTHSTSSFPLLLSRHPPMSPFDLLLPMPGPEIPHASESRLSIDPSCDPNMSTIEVAGSTRANDQGLFQCGSCKRHYNRLDHLARHVRSRKQMDLDDGVFSKDCVC
jgi:hypothetical protein